MSDRDADVVIVGGGPGGAALGRLLAGSGLRVLLLESARAVPVQYRAELIQPSSMPVLDLCGVGEEVRSRSRQLAGMEVFGARRRLFHVPYSHLGEQYRLLSLPIHETRSLLLDFACPPDLTVQMGARVTGLVQVDGVRGVTYTQGGHEHTVTARLVVAADGRTSTIRALAGIDAQEKNYSVQIVTMNGVGGTADIDHVRLHVHDHRFMALAPSTGDEIRIGWAIPTGNLGEMRKGPVSALAQQLVEHEPSVEPWAAQLQSWRDVHLQPLTTVVARTWALDGLMLLGDAAHAVSPFGGQGLNMALHDALIATPIIHRALEATTGPASGKVLSELQALREGTCRMMLRGGDKALQIFGPRFPQPLRETVMGTAGRLGIPRRVALPNLALGPGRLRGQLAEAAAAYPMCGRPATSTRPPSARPTPARPTPARPTPAPMTPAPAASVLNTGGS